MHLIFGQDSPIMQFLNRFSSLVVLNVLFLCTSIPIFTIGASLTAMYDVVFRMDTQREGKTASAFFQAFRANFRQATCIWLVFAFLLGTGCANIVIFSNMDSVLSYPLFLLAMVVVINALLILGWAFPLLSQFDNSVGKTLKNALLLSIANLPRTLLIAVVNCFPWALIFMHLYAFVKMSFLWVALYFAAAAYFNSRVLMKVLGTLREEPASDK